MILLNLFIKYYFIIYYLKKLYDDKFIKNIKKKMTNDLFQSIIFL